MFVSPYETTLCRSFKLDALQKILERADLQDPFPNPTSLKVDDGSKVGVVTPHEAYLDVPPFTQPVILKSGKVVFDGRAFMSAGSRTGDFKVRSHTDYNFEVIRCGLMVTLNSNDLGALVNLQKTGWQFFNSWVINSIVTRLNLKTDLDIQMRMSIISAFFFFSLFYSQPTDALNNDFDANCYKVADTTGAPYALVEEIGSQLKPMANVKDFCENIAEATGALRLEKFNFPSLFAMISSSWFGVNAREIVGVSLEHIPTFYALCYCAIEDRSYRRTTLSQRLDSFRDRNARSRFVSTVRQLYLKR